MQGSILSRHWSKTSSPLRDIPAKTSNTNSVYMNNMRLRLIVALTALDVIFCGGVSAQAPPPDRKPAPAAGVKATVELSTGITVTRGWQSRLGLEETGGKEISMIFSGVAKPTIE